MDAEIFWRPSTSIRRKTTVKLATKSTKNTEGTGAKRGIEVVHDESRLKADAEPDAEFKAFLTGSMRRPPVDLVQMRIHIGIAHAEQDKANRGI